MWLNGNSPTTQPNLSQHCALMGLHPINYRSGNWIRSSLASHSHGSLLTTVKSITVYYPPVKDAQKCEPRNSINFPEKNDGEMGFVFLRYVPAAKIPTSDRMG